MKKNSKVNISENQLPDADIVKKFEMLFPMISSDLNEIRELSKKKQDELLNKFKVTTINKKLEQIKIILSGEPTSDFLELLDEDTLPSNSDAVLLISQFVQAMQQFKAKYYTKDRSDFEEFGDYYSWKIRN